MSSCLVGSTIDTARALACLAVVVIIVLMAFGQPVAAGGVLLVGATALLAAAQAQALPVHPQTEHFCVGCNVPAIPGRQLVMSGSVQAQTQLEPQPQPPVQAPPQPQPPRRSRKRSRAALVDAVLAKLARQRRHEARHHSDSEEDDDERREAYGSHQAQAPAFVGHQEREDAEGWVQGMAPQRPGAVRRLHPSQSIPFNPKSMVNADTDGNPGTCSLVIRDHFRPGGDQAMVLKPRFGGWVGPGLGLDTSTPRRAMEAQRQVFNRNLMGFRNALLWPRYQSSEYQLRGINSRANVYDCGASPYTGSPSVPIFN